MKGKVDRNQAEIVRALRQAGCSVLSLSDMGHGCPDLLVGFRAHNLLFEVKDGMAPPSKQRLTPDEQLWRDVWRGQFSVVKSVAEALAAVEQAAA